MKTKILILIFFSLFTFHISHFFSQPVQQVWVRTYDSLPGSSSSMALDSMQNIIVTGSIHLTSGRTDWCTIKYNTSGTQQWVAIYDGIPTSNGINAPTAIGIDQQNNVYVTGYSERSGFGSDDYCTIKYNPNGIQQWVARYNNGIGSKNDASALALDSAGNIYITGYSTSSGAGYDIVTIKYNQNGDSLWVRRYDDPQHFDDAANSIALDNSGNVIVCGGIGSSYNIITIKYNSSGVQQWVNIGVMGALKKVRTDNNGNIYVTGWEQVGTRDDYTTIKYNNSGVQQWKKNYNYLGTNFSSDDANDLALDYQGNVYVTGRSYNGTYTDYATIKYNLSGTQQWVQRYNRMTTEITGSTISIDRSNNIYITGIDWNGSNFEFATLKYNDSGVQQWLMTYQGRGRSVLIDSIKNVYVTGTDGNFLTTIKYLQLVSIHSISNFVPDKSVLKQNYPNPFNPNTLIKYSLSHKSFVKLDIFDVLGRKVENLINYEQNSGEYNLNFIGTNLSSGVYIYRIVATYGNDNFTDSKIMILQK